MDAQSSNGLTMNDVWEYFGPAFKEEFEKNFYMYHQRAGQSFMNALYRSEWTHLYFQLTSSHEDVYYSDSWHDILAAFEYILERK